MPLPESIIKAIPSQFEFIAKADAIADNQELVGYLNLLTLDDAAKTLMLLCLLRLLASSYAKDATLARILKRTSYLSERIKAAEDNEIRLPEVTKNLYQSLKALGLRELPLIEANYHN